MLIVFLSSFGLTSGTSVDVDRDTKSMYKAIFISNFTSLVDWPADYRTGLFVIEVYDKSDGLFNLLTKKYAGKAVGSQEIKVIKYNPSKPIKSHIIYVSKEYSYKLVNIETSIKNKSTLLISNNLGDLKRGSTINFVINKNKNNKLAFEINTLNAKKHNLILASKLSTLALKVR